jgi:hypothetical protein
VRCRCCHFCCNRLLPSLGYEHHDARLRCPWQSPVTVATSKDLAAGRTDMQIVRRLGISEGSVRTHLETSTRGWTSPAAPPPSPVPSRTRCRVLHDVDRFADPANESLVFVGSKLVRAIDLVMLNVSWTMRPARIFSYALGPPSGHPPPL